MKSLLIFLSGGFFGAGISYIVTRSYMERINEEEMRKYREDTKRLRSRKEGLDDDPEAKNADGSIKEEKVSYKDDEESVKSDSSHYTHYHEIFKATTSPINLSKSVTRDSESEQIEEESSKDADDVKEFNADGTVNVIIVPEDTETIEKYMDRAHYFHTVYFDTEEKRFLKMDTTSGNENGFVECDAFDIPFDINLDVLDFTNSDTVHLWDAAAEAIYTIMAINYSVDN